MGNFLLYQMEINVVIYIQTRPLENEHGYFSCKSVGKSLGGKEVEGFRRVQWQRTIVFDFWPIALRFTVREREKRKKMILRSSLKEKGAWVRNCGLTLTLMLILILILSVRIVRVGI